MNPTLLSWKDHPNNPLITPPFPEWLIADPTVLPADESPDGKWHLFAHGLLGLYHYRSYDGLHWQRAKGIISFFALRPFIYHEGEKYYLLYEKLNAPYRFPFYNSHLELRHSTDLVHWSQPKTILKPRFSWHKTKNKIGNLGNPCLIKTKGGYRLYYSSGLIRPKDCLFCEPAYQGMAWAKKINGPYRLHHKPTPMKYQSAKTHISATRVFIGKGYVLRLLTLIDLRYQKRQSRSTIHLSSSTNGLHWTTGKEIIFPKNGWKKTHVYVGSFVKKINGQWRIYYNARENHSLFGREKIGLATSI